MGRSERRESFEVGHRTQEVEECGGAGEDPEEAVAGMI